MNRIVSRIISIRPKTAHLAQSVSNLHINIAPFAHAIKRQKMLLAKSPHLTLRSQFLKRIVIRLPDIQQRDKIRLSIHKPLVLLVCRLLLLERPHARVLNANCRRNNQHLAQSAFFLRLQNHPRYRWRERQPRHIAPQRCQTLVIINRVQRPQHTKSPLNSMRTGGINKRKRLHIAQPQRNHPQNDLGQIRPLNLGLRVFWPREKTFLIVQTNTHPILHAPTPPGPLPGTALRNLLHR